MPISKTCPVCMNVFQVPPVREHSAKTCSTACKAVLMKRETRDGWATKTCAECGNDYRCPNHEASRRKFCSYECKASSESRKWAAYESPGRAVSKHGDGYLLEYAPTHPFAANGYVMQHRLVMERELRSAGAAVHLTEQVGGDSYLRRDVDVHHRNGKKDDNRFTNLVACTPAAHLAIHHGMPVGVNEAWPLDGLLVAEVVRSVRCTCKQCGVVFERHPSEIKRGHATFCSRACYDKSLGGDEMPSRVTLKCKACGAAFDVARSRVRDGSAKFCSEPCRMTGLHQARKRSL
jgi:hypothetical protein